MIDWVYYVEIGRIYRYSIIEAAKTWICLVKWNG